MHFPDISPEPELGPEPAIDTVAIVAAPEPAIAAVAMEAAPEPAIDVVAMGTAPEPEDFPELLDETTLEPAIEIPPLEPVFELNDGIDPESKKNKLHRYILENIIRDRNCVSMKTLTDIYGFDGKDKKKRNYVKKIIEEMFGGQLMFISVVNEPQVVSHSDAQSSGEVYHGNCHDSLNLSRTLG